MWCQILVVGCHDKSPVPDEPLERVVVVYMMGENSLSNYAQHDLSEMRRALAQIPDRCRLAVFFDNSRTDQKPQVLLFDGKGTETTLFTYRSDPVSTDSVILQGVLNLVMQKCPARNYGLVMWSHGSGWVPAHGKRTIGIDNGHNNLTNVGTEMEVTTLVNVLRRTNVVWDYVMFDACFMQSAEVCYELRDVAHWCIASPAEIPASGAPYDRLMAAFFLPTEEAWKIAKQYHEDYSSQGGLVISAVNTARMEALADATAQVMSALPQYPPTDDIQQYLKADDAGLPHFYDIGSAMYHWLGEGSAYQQWLSILQDVVPHGFLSPSWATSYDDEDYTLTDADHACGLSLYIPVEGSTLNACSQETAWGKRVIRP